MRLVYDQFSFLRKESSLISKLWDEVLGDFFEKIRKGLVMYLSVTVPFRNGTKFFEKYKEINLFKSFRGLRK